MTKRLAMLMDPIGAIHPQKDTSFAILLAAQARDWQLYYFTADALFARDGEIFATLYPVRVFDVEDSWFSLQEPVRENLAEFDIVFMRKDPPFNMEYIYLTYLLEQVERQGTLVVNRPQSLRNFNEKCILNYFPDCCPPTLISADKAVLMAFIQQQEQVILKPLDGMGGRSIYYLTPQDKNTAMILQTATASGNTHVMLQRFIPAVEQGDKRVILINGEPVPYLVRRVPPRGQIRANLAAGGHAVGDQLSERDRWLCSKIGSFCRDQGLYFVGVDIIGDYITEINVTSPTCAREIETFSGIEVCEQLLDALMTQLQ